MSSKNDELVKKIVLERIRNMAPNVKIALGSKGEFLGKDALIKEVASDTDIGKKIVNIQLRYMRALKEGLV